MYSMGMTKDEFLTQLWNDQQEWAYLTRTAYILKDFTQPIIEAMRESADMIIKADDIKNSYLELEPEDPDDVYPIIETMSEKVSRANNGLRYEVHGSKTRAYWYDSNCIKRRDSTQSHLIMTLFRQCLAKRDPSIVNGQRYNGVLRFIEAGCVSLKNG